MNTKKSIAKDLIAFLKQNKQYKKGMFNQHTSFKGHKSYDITFSTDIININKIREYLRTKYKQTFECNNNEYTYKNILIVIANDDYYSTSKYDGYMISINNY